MSSGKGMRSLCQLLRLDAIRDLDGEVQVRRGGGGEGEADVWWLGQVLEPGIRHREGLSDVCQRARPEAKTYISREFCVTGSGFMMPTCRLSVPGEEVVTFHDREWINGLCALSSRSRTWAPVGRRSCGLARGLHPAPLDLPQAGSARSRPYAPTVARCGRRSSQALRL